MAHLIDKDRVLAEINKRINDAPINYIGHQRVWAYNDVKDIIDTLEVKEVQEEPVSDRFVFKAIPRLLEMVEPTDRAKAYIAKLADTLEVEGYSTDAKIVRENLKIMNGEKVPMATMDEEPVSEDLDDAADSYTRKVLERRNCLIGNQSVGEEISKAVNFGAKWKVENLWKSADGDDLPEIDREVIALQNNGKVVYAHRPSAYWDGKNIDTGKVTRYYPKTYDKGGWNIPDVKYWLDYNIDELLCEKNETDN